MDDFDKLLNEGIFLDVEEINNRKQGFYISNVSSVSIGECAREEYFSNFKTPKEDSDILKTRRGICASAGVVRGVLEFV